MYFVNFAFLILLFCHMHCRILRLPCGKFDAKFSEIYSSRRLVRSGFSASLKISSFTDCVSFCFKTLGCKSINVNKKMTICELLDATITDADVWIETNAEWIHFETEKNPKNLGPICVKRRPCKNGGSCVDTCDNLGFECTCPTFLKNARRIDCAVDMALLKPAYQSSTRKFEQKDKNGVAKNAVDGNLKTKSWTEVGNGEWWLIDFEEIVAFDEIYLKFAELGKYRKTMEESLVKISNSSERNHEQLCHKVSDELPSRHYRFRCIKSPTTARYLRIVTTKEGMIILWKVEIYGWKI